MTWIERVRHELQHHRDAGQPFDRAWRIVLANHPPCDDWSPLVSDHPNMPRMEREFVKRHMRAAYERDDTSLGRLRVPERDTSMAVTMSRATRREGICRSGAGCSEPATRGEFGSMWCDQHGAELVRIRETHFPGGGFGQGRRIGSLAA